MQNMKETEEEQKKRIVFLSSFVSGFKEELHTDILLKPGDDGPPVPAHRALLVNSMTSSSVSYIYIYMDGYISFVFVWDLWVFYTFIGYIYKCVIFHSHQTIVYMALIKTY